MCQQTPDDRVSQWEDTVTGYLTGTYCGTCGYIYTEPVTGGRCPVCKYYGRDGYLFPYDDPRWLRVVTLVTYIEDEELRRRRRPTATPRADADTLTLPETDGEIEIPREVARAERRLSWWEMILKALAGDKNE
ncbi:MAG: hypothetical protein U0768_05580 [Anaerolineae bacterium]